MIDENTKIMLQALQGLENSLKEIKETLDDFDRNLIGDHEYFRQLRIEMMQLREETELKFDDLKKNVTHLSEM